MSNPEYQRIPLSIYHSLTKDELGWALFPTKNGNTWNSSLIDWNNIPDKVIVNGETLQKEDEGILGLAPVARANLILLAKRLGYKLNVIKAYSSEKHERHLAQESKGVYESFKHNSGLAFDIVIQNKYAKEFISTARSQGFGGIGGYSELGYIHIDMNNPTTSWGDYGLYAEQFDEGLSTKARNFRDKRFQLSSYIEPIND